MTVYIDFQAKIQHLSGDALIITLQDLGTQGKNLSVQGIDKDNKPVKVSEEQGRKAFAELRRCLLDFLP